MHSSGRAQIHNQVELLGPDARFGSISRAPIRALQANLSAGQARASGFACPRSALVERLLSKQRHKGDPGADLLLATLLQQLSHRVQSDYAAGLRPPDQILRAE